VLIYKNTFLQTEKLCTMVGSRRLNKLTSGTQGAESRVSVL